VAAIMLTNSTNDSSKRNQLLEMALVIDSHPNWWRFPTETVVEGFLGTDPIFIVGDQPSTSKWDVNNRNRRGFYDTLVKIGAANAHLTDLYKRRGSAGELRTKIPEDLQDHVKFFRKEVELLNPTRVLALGDLAYQFLALLTPELIPKLKRAWHFSYAVRYGKLSEYESQLRDAIGGA
jgi:hypothetical protein